MLRHPVLRGGHALSRSPLDSVDPVRDSPSGYDWPRSRCFWSYSERGSSSHRKVGSSQFWPKRRRGLGLLHRSGAVGRDFVELACHDDCVVIAWILASAVGVAVGLSLGLLPTLERIMSPFLDAANAMPRLALAPLLIVIFGITMTAKVALAFTLVFFIVCSSARAGVKTVDDEWLRLSTVLNASKTQVFWHILLPVATPGIFAGLRLG